jgi:RelA/SpoT family protein/TGS domain-containing protein
MARFVRKEITRVADGAYERTRLESEMMYSEEIYCRTPQGRSIKFPKGATAIDFAYAVHTEIGNRAIGCMINGKISPLMTPLEDGDEIKIITQSRSAPPASWDNLVVTGKARREIRKAARQLRQREFASLGREMLATAFERSNLEFSDAVVEQKLYLLRSKSLSDLYYHIGHGDVSASDVTKLIKDSYNRPGPAAPPAIPAQGAGPHFAIRDDGIVDLAPASSLDSQGNNIDNLRALHPFVRQIAGELAQSLSRGNTPHSGILQYVKDYATLIDQQVEHISFAPLYIAGIRIENAATQAELKIKEGELPSLDFESGERLATLLRLHGVFMLSTAVGIAFLAAEERYQRRPEEERELRKITLAFARELEKRPDIIAPRAAAILVGAAGELGVGTHPERTAVAALATAKNVAVVMISGALLGALQVALGMAGPAGTVGAGLVALFGGEGLKHTKSFLAISGLITKSLDNLSESNVQIEVLKRAKKLRKYVGFALKAEPVLRDLAERSAYFEWIKPAIDWLAQQKSDADSRRDERNTP